MIGIIGGSGFYNFVDNMKIKTIDTPFGVVNLEIGNLWDKKIFFIPRHGKKHSIAPSQINYKANIFVAHKLKAMAIIATNAVGSIRQNIPPGSFATPKHIIDFTNNRNTTFFDGSGFSVTTQTGKLLQGVVHVDVTDVFDEKIRKLLSASASELGIKIIDNGTIVATNGPRFESPAEIKAFGILGADYASMTSSPEVFLAKELEIPYATLAVITNYAAGLQNKVSAKEVFKLFLKKIKNTKDIIKGAILAMDL